MSKYITDSEFEEYQELKKQHKGIVFKIDFFSPYGTQFNLITDIDLSDNLREEIHRIVAKEIWSVQKFFEKTYQEKLESIQKWEETKTNDLRTAYKEMLDNFNASPWYRKLLYKFNTNLDK